MITNKTPRANKEHVLIRRKLNGRERCLLQDIHKQNTEGDNRMQEMTLIL